MPSSWKMRLAFEAHLRRRLEETPCGQWGKCLVSLADGGRRDGEEMFYSLGHISGTAIAAFVLHQRESNRQAVRARLTRASRTNDNTGRLYSCFKSLSSVANSTKVRCSAHSCCDLKCMYAVLYSKEVNICTIHQRPCLPDYPLTFETPRPRLSIL